MFSENISDIEKGTNFMFHTLIFDRLYRYPSSIMEIHRAVGGVTYWYISRGVKVRNPCVWKIWVISQMVWFALEFHSPFGLMKSRCKPHFVGYTLYFLGAWFHTLIFYLHVHDLQASLTLLIVSCCDITWFVCLPQCWYYVHVHHHSCDMWLHHTCNKSVLSTE